MPQQRARFRKCRKVFNSLSLLLNLYSQVPEASTSIFGFGQVAALAIERSLCYVV